MKFYQNDPRIKYFWSKRMFDNDYISQTWNNLIEGLLLEASIEYIENHNSFIAQDVFPEVDSE